MSEMKIIKNEISNLKLSFVLPVASEFDLQLVSNFLLPSFLKYFKLEEIEDFIVITRSDELATIQKALMPFELDCRLTIISEEEILNSSIKKFKLIGWELQQVLKLHISEIVKTRHYCTLDADCFLVQKTQVSDFVIDGKCIFNSVPADKHKKWWRKSAKFLKVDKQFLKELKWRFGVTPSLLHTEVVTSLIEESPYPIAKGIKKGATEYCLYWLHLCNKFNVDDYYIDNSRSVYGNCIWVSTLKKQSRKIRKSNEWVQEILKETFVPGNAYYFSIFQSLLKKQFPIEIRKELLHQHIG